MVRAGPGPVTESELSSFFSWLASQDQNNLAASLSLEPGCRTRPARPTDCSPRPLFGSLQASQLRARPVYSRLMALYDNYQEDVTSREDRTSQERREEEDFLTEIINTQTMQETIKFLRNKQLWKKSNNDFKKKLSELWFENYSRGGRILGSSGFEHVFLGEKKNGKVQGFHNWVYFYHMEATNKVFRMIISELQNVLNVL